MKVDWGVAGEEATIRLQEMIRFDTTNPPGNELPLVRYLANRLEEEGLDPKILGSGEGRGNLVVRLKGDGSERPVLLLSHLDVVPSEPEKWTYPPFSGEVVEGCVWGRGAIDSKLTGAVGLQVLLLFKRLGLHLKRDLVLVAASDEEQGGVKGVEWLIEHYPEVFDAEYGINEGGGFSILIDGHPFYTCQVAEKGSASLNLIGHGQPGHSSVPHNQNPIFCLARALQALGEHKMPHRVPNSVHAFFNEAARVQSRKEVGALLQRFLDSKFQNEVLDQIPVNDATRLMFDAMVRNTCAPTILEAGLKRNVIPSDATAQLSGRPLPGVSEASFLKEVREIVGEGVDFEMEGPFRPGVEFLHETPFFQAIRASMQRLAPEGIVVPFMQTGGSDARFLVNRDITVYGFIPMRYENGMDFFELCHGHNERVSKANIQFAVEVLFDIVCRLNGVV